MKAPKFLKSKKGRLLFFGFLLVFCVTATVYFSVYEESYPEQLLNNIFQPKVSRLILIAIPVITAVLVIGISNEIFSGDLHAWLKGEDDKTQTDSQENTETEVEKFYNSLKQRYQTRYQSKLDGRFEITLEVSDDFDSPPRSITEQFGENATKGEAIEIIRQAFEQKGRLLIAGNPGVGKTVLLLKLAIDLLDKIKDLEKEPFPVIFNLASWSEEYENFGDWLKAMLISGYGFSRAFAETFLRQERIIFLLDGLDELARNEPDEIAAEKRAKCLASLNDYLSGERKAVICSRIEEFLSMKKQRKQDAPVSAKVRVLNLTPKQVLESLRRAKDDENLKHHTAAKSLLKIFDNGENKNLLEALRTPFYFTTAMEIFDREILNQNDLPKSIAEIKTYLIENFVERKLKNTPNPNFGSEKTKKWLKWLAKLMERKQLVAFELADLQPTDLARKWLFSLFGGLFSGLFGGFVYSLVEGLLFAFLDELLVAIVGSLIFGLAFILAGSLYFGLVFALNSNEISTEDIVRLDFSRLLNLKCLKNLLIQGLIFGIIGGVFFSLLYSLFSGLVLGLFSSLLGSLERMLDELRKIENITYLQSPYQRIYGGFWGNLVSAFVILVTIVGVVLSLSYIESKSLSSIAAVFVSGGTIFPIIWMTNTTMYKHLILRFCLYIENAMPIKYTTFLDYAAGLRILEKDGGQWRFRHQNLQEYFANLDNQTKAS